MSERKTAEEMAREALRPLAEQHNGRTVDVADVVALMERLEKGGMMATVNLDMSGIPIIDGREIREVMIRGAHVTLGGVLVLETDDGSGRGPVHVIVIPPNLGPLLAVVAETLTRFIRPGPPPPGVMPSPGAPRVG